MHTRTQSTSAMGDDGAKVKGIVESVFKGLDETVSEYLVSVLSDDPHQPVSGSRGS